MKGEEKTISVPERVIDATHRVGFLKRVRELAQEDDCISMRDAYEAANEELQSYGFPERYSNYNSFRYAYYLWIRTQLEQGK
jgi:hypothetical protein